MPALPSLAALLRFPCPNRQNSCRRSALPWTCAARPGPAQLQAEAGWPAWSRRRKHPIVAAVYNPFAGYGHAASRYQPALFRAATSWWLTACPRPAWLDLPASRWMGLGNGIPGQRLRQELRPRDPGGSISANLVTDEPPDPTRDIGPHAFLDDAFTITSGRIGANDRLPQPPAPECRTPLAAAAGYRGRHYSERLDFPLRSRRRDRSEAAVRTDIAPDPFPDSRRATRVNWRAFADISRVRRSFEPSCRESSGRWCWAQRRLLLNR